MARKTDLATVLAEKMMQVLNAQLRPEGSSRVVTLRQLAELADPGAPADLLQKLASKRDLFKGRALCVQTKNLDSPVIVLQDAEEFARSSELLEFLVGSTCNATNPTCDPAKLKSKIHLKLRPAFESTLKRRLAENDLPPGIAVVSAKTKKLLHAQRYPLPKAPDEALAEAMLRELERRRQQGGDAYPLSVARLVESCRSGANDTVVKKALAHRVFKDGVVSALKNKPDAPCALCGDEELLAGSTLLLETSLDAACSSRKGAHTAPELTKRVIPALQAPMTEAVRRRAANQELPARIGCIAYKNALLLFRLADVGTSSPKRTGLPAGEPSAPSIAEREPAHGDFARAFAAAFEQLDRQRGAHNAVSLVDLRRALPVDRQVFDSELRELRRARRYTLSGAEGRHGISPEERDAGIYEDGSLLLYVSRRLT
jgi:hypothetical protein